MMTKKEQRLRRSRQTRARIAIQRVARLTVLRSNTHIYAQVISEDGARVLASASTVEKEVREQLSNGGNVAAAALIGKRIAEKAKAAGVEMSRSTVPVSPTTAASRRWPRPPAKPVCSSDASRNTKWQSFNPARRPKAMTTA